MRYGKLQPHVRGVVNVLSWFESSCSHDIDCLNFHRPGNVSGSVEMNHGLVEHLAGSLDCKSSLKGVGVRVPPNPLWDCYNFIDL